MAPHGMVATSHPLAAQIGLDVLKQGGNAVDAAIATNAALGLMEPMSCGIGGDLFAIVWDAKTQKLYGLNASGRSPYKATRAVLRGEGPRRRSPTTGPLSWSVPGCVDGWDELRQAVRHACRSSELLAPSIGYAEEGFPVTRGDRRLLARRRANARASTPTRRRPILPDGKAPAGRRGVQEPAPGPHLPRDRRRTAATPSTRARSPRRSSPSPTRSAACSR